MKIQVSSYSITVDEQKVIDKLKEILPNEDALFDGRITDYESVLYPHEWVELVNTVIPGNDPFWEKVEYCYSIKVII